MFLALYAFFKESDEKWPSEWERIWSPICTIPVRYREWEWKFSARLYLTFLENFGNGTFKKFTFFNLGLQRGFESTSNLWPELTRPKAIHCRQLSGLSCQIWWLPFTCNVNKNFETLYEPFVWFKIFPEAWFYFFYVTRPEFLAFLIWVDTPPYYFISIFIFIFQI